MNQIRLDVRVVQDQLAESREKAQRLIRAGAILVNRHAALKPSEMVTPEDQVERIKEERFVSRGGEKLEAAFTHFSLNVEKAICLDAGASTGGFTDCLLQHGAARVYAVDVGTGQLHWKLQSDPRVVIMDDRNARYLKPSDLPETPNFACMDVSFISLTKVLPAVTQVLARGSHLVTLIKPQFEAERNEIGKGGVVKDPEIRTKVVEKIKAFGTTELGLKWLGVCESPIKGPAGNIEFLAHWEKT